MLATTYPHGVWGGSVWLLNKKYTASLFSVNNPQRVNKHQEELWELPSTMKQHIFCLQATECQGAGFVQSQATVERLLNVFSFRLLRPGWDLHCHICATCQRPRFLFPGCNPTQIINRANTQGACYQTARHNPTTLYTVTYLHGETPGCPK